MRRKTKHHRLPSSRGGKTNNSNCVMLDAYTHETWHKLFSNMTPCEIQWEICKTFYGFNDMQMKDTRVESFIDLVCSVTEGKDRC